MVAPQAAAQPGGNRSRGNRGRTGTALGRLDPAALDPVGQVRVGSEIWSARSAEPIDPGATVTINSVDGLTLHVEPTRRAGEA